MDSYSAFFENDQTSSTGLAGYAATLGIKTVVVGGLAADYCVYYTVMDALRLGLEVYLLEDAIRSVDSGTGEAALRAMKEAGVPFIRSGDL
jgi:nicotinamidase/pyrazinamidase